MEKPRSKPRLERATSAAAAPPLPAAIKVIKQLPKYVNPYAQPKATGTVATKPNLVVLPKKKATKMEKMGRSNLKRRLKLCERSKWNYSYYILIKVKNT